MDDANDFVRQATEELEEQDPSTGIRPHPVIEASETTLETTRFGMNFSPQPLAEALPGGPGEPPPPTEGCTLHFSCHVCFQWRVFDDNAFECLISVDEDVEVDVDPNETDTCFLDQDQTPGTKGSFTYNLLSQTVIPLGDPCLPEVDDWIVGMKFTNIHSGLNWSGSQWEFNWQIDVPNYPGTASFSFGPIVFGSAWEDIATAGPIDDGESCIWNDPPNTFKGGSVTNLQFSLI